MKPTSSKYEELTFIKANDSFNTAVSLSLEMLNDTSTQPRSAEPAEQEKNDETEYTEKESRHSFNMIAVVLIGIAIASAILGAVLVKNFVQGNSSQKVVLSQERQ